MLRHFNHDDETRLKVNRVARVHFPKTVRENNLARLVQQRQSRVQDVHTCPMCFRYESASQGL